MTQHTPGPWTLGNAQDCSRNHAICAGPQVIARVLGRGYPPGKGWSEITQANARLIAAAPQLLEALRSFIVNLNAVGENHFRKDWPDLYHCGVKARAAIKATKGA